MARGQYKTNINTHFTPRQVHKSNAQHYDAYPPTVVIHSGGPPDQYKHFKHN